MEVKGKTAGWSLVAVTSLLPKVVVVVVGDCLHLSVAQVARQGVGIIT